MVHKRLLPYYFVFLAISLLAFDIPFFWDSAFFSELAVKFHDHGFAGCIPDTEHDTGGFPLYSVYLALFWKISGKTLLGAHLALLLPGFLLFHQFQVLAKRFIKAEFLWIPLLLFLADPTIITQFLLMGYDIFMSAFFLLALNAYLHRNNKLFSLAITLLMLTNVRGCLFAAVLLAVVLFNDRKRFKESVLLCLPGIVLFFSWLVYHHAATGWWLFSPAREGTSEQLLPLSALFKQGLLIAWKLADLGKIACWSLLVVGSYRIGWQERQVSVTRNMLLVTTAGFVLIYLPWSNPVGPKYFIPVFLLLLLACSVVLSHLSKKGIRNLLVALLLFASIGSNWLHYPERYGNAWDASLKVLPYFKLRTQMDRFISEQGIAADSIGTQFPLIDDPKYSLLKEEGNAYQNVWRGPLENFPYILYSNVINSDIPEQFEAVRSNWQLVKSLEKGQVVLELYRQVPR